MYDIEETNEYLYINKILIFKKNVSLNLNIYSKILKKCNKIVMLKNFNICLSDIIIFTKYNPDYYYKKFLNFEYYLSFFCIDENESLNDNNKIIPKQIDFSTYKFIEFIMKLELKSDIILPKNIKLIKLAYSFNNDIINLHETECNYFIMGDEFNKKIFLPETIIFLEIGKKYNHCINLPHNLKFLVLGNNHNDIINYLPNSVENLILINFIKNQIDFNFYDLPNSIKKIKLIDENIYLQYFEKIKSIPENIIRISYHFNIDYLYSHSVKKINSKILNNIAFKKFFKFNNYNILIIDKIGNDDINDIDIKTLLIICFYTYLSFLLFATNNKIIDLENYFNLILKLIYIFTTTKIYKYIKQFILIGIKRNCLSKWCSSLHEIKLNRFSFLIINLLFDNEYHILNDSLYVFLEKILNKINWYKNKFFI